MHPKMGIYMQENYTGAQNRLTCMKNMQAHKIDLYRQENCTGTQNRLIQAIKLYRHVIIDLYGQKYYTATKNRHIQARKLYRHFKQTYYYYYLFMQFTCICIKLIIANNYHKGLIQNSQKVTFTQLRCNQVFQRFHHD